MFLLLVTRTLYLLPTSTARLTSRTKDSIRTIVLASTTSVVVDHCRIV